MSETYEAVIHGQKKNLSRISVAVAEAARPGERPRDSGEDPKGERGNPPSPKGRRRLGEDVSKAQQ